MTTSFEAIRNQQCTVIEALTPTKHSRDKFRRYAETVDFDTWVRASPAAALRRFQILSNFDIKQGPTADGAVEQCEHTFTLRIGYPMFAGLYGLENQRDVEDLVAADMHQIDAAIGLNGGSNYVSSQHVCKKESVEFVQYDEEKALVISIIFSVLYDRSV